MSKNKKEPKITLTIDHIDPLGQGVAKHNGHVYFVPKTLPGEVVSAKIMKKSKGVHFAKIENELDIKTPSELRIQSDCPHFGQCSGCQFLHVSYQNENLFKLNTLKRALDHYLKKSPQNLKPEETQITFHSSPNRFGYRNRLQLHYDTWKNIIGFQDNNSSKIIPIRDCLLATRPIRQKIQEITTSQTFLQQISNDQPRQGHFEIYQKNNGPELFFNESYAQGGFTQVNEEMNLQMCQWVKDQLALTQNSACIELFGGEGNLTNSIPDMKTWIFDLYPKGVPPKTQTKHFMHLDIYDQEALQVVSKFKSPNSILLLDPPRSGLKNLIQFAENLCPSKIIYISCNHQTLFRDIEQLQDYKITQCHLFDMFPGTRHFETGVTLER